MKPMQMFPENYRNQKIKIAESKSSRFITHAATVQNNIQIQ